MFAITSVQGPKFPSQNLQIPSTQKVIYPTSVERKQIVPPLSYRSKVKPRSDVNCGEVTKQDKHYLPQQASQIYHSLNRLR